MTTEKLDIMQTIKDGVQYGLKNFFPLLLMVLLYVVTVWIPYLNVGTTIGFYKAIIGIGRGETIDPTAIFAKENFSNIGGFFLLTGFIAVGTIAAACFMLLPAYVIGIAWGFAIYFYLDKKVSPLKSLQLSYDTTFGNKWRIFFTELICVLLICVVCGILGAIPKVGGVLALIAALVCSAIVVAIEGVMYDFFSKKADTILAEKRERGHRGPCGPDAGNPDAGEPVIEETVIEAEVDEVIDSVRTEA